MQNSDRTNPVEDLFLRALELPSPDREAFLATECVETPQLLAQIQELLDAHEQTGSFVADRQAEWTTPESNGSLQIGQTIGPYTLREKIGEGGMGEVYVAEQEKPIARKVALKVIKPGMDSKAVLARFEAEQQALAMMNHRNIAKVLDAGMSPSGSPYFVMELVAGMPITEYCDEKKLNIEERLQLFVQVCRAIQHAHQKGIIHRDIKPSNVLVTEEDGNAVPKVIDFGVAKALSQKLTDRTLYTNFQAFLGTPLYASPEQASLSNVDVDTRSDVYSLGVLLYELVTGATPYDREQLQKAAYEEMCRIIREQEAVRPSARLTTLGPSASTISERRRSDPNRLIQSVRGDLDWIIMKALEKDRARRYVGPNAFASDIERMLRRETIEARPPALPYVIARMLQRNRLKVAGGALLSVLFICATTILWLRHRTDEMTEIFAQSTRAKVDSLIISNKPEEAMQFLDAAQELGVSRELVEMLKSQIALFNPISYAKAVSSLENQRQRSPEPNLARDSMLCLAYQRNGKEELHLDLLEEILQGTPKSFEECIYRGYATNIFFPRKAREDLLEARRLEPTSQLALLVLSETELSLGELSIQPEVALSHLEESIAGFQAVEKFIPNNGTVLSGLAYARLNLGLRFRSLGNASLSERYLKLADSDFNSLPLSTQEAFRARAAYFLSIGSLPRLRDDYDLALETCGAHNHQALAVAIADFRSGDGQGALETLEHTVDIFSAAFRVFVLMDDFESADELRTAFEKALEGRDSSERVYGLFDSVLWRLLGDKKRASNSLLRVRQLAERTNQVAWSKQADFLTGTATSKEMFDSAETTFDLAYAHFYAAFCFLGENERLLAKKQFTELVQLNRVELFATQWGQAFLEKIDDPDWLPWIDPIESELAEDD